MTAPPHPEPPATRDGTRSRRHAVGLFTLTLALSGCLSVRPLAEIRARLPSDQFVAVDGRAVHVVQAQPPGGAGTTLPLVLLHGFGESTFVWRHLLPRLGETRRVIAVDLNGFGYTERPRSVADYTYAGQTRLVLGVLDALGISRADFAGHSYGGGLALFLAGHHPERIGRLVLVDNTLPVFAQARRSRLASIGALNRLALAAFLRPSYVARGLRKAYHDDSLVTDETVAAVLAGVKVEGVVDAYRGLSARLPASLANDPAEQPVALEAIAAPALVVWGSEDRLITLEVGRRNAARLPNARFEVIAACGHVPMEETPEALLAMMEPFLAAELDPVARVAR